MEKEKQYPLVPFSSDASQELNAARLWFHRSSPFPRFAHITVTSALCVALAGRKSVHIIEVGQDMTAQWPTVIHLLASGAPKGPDGRPQLHVRITVLSTTMLVCSGRSDLRQLFSAGDRASIVRETAAGCGITAQVCEVELDEESLCETLLGVSRGRDEAVAVCSIHEMDYLLDGSVVEPGIRETLLQVCTCLRADCTGL